MSKKIDVIASQFLARYQVHQLRIFIWENWAVLFELLPQTEINGKTPRSNKTHDFISIYTVPEDAGGASRWSRVPLKENAGIPLNELVYMRDHPTEKVSVNAETNPISSEQIYERIIDTALKNFRRAFQWSDSEFIWKFGVHSKKSWPLVNLLKADLLDGFAGSSWYLYKYKKWAGKEGVERMLLKIEKTKDDLGFYTATIEGVGLDEDDFMELFEGLVTVDNKGRTVFLMKGLSGAFANLVLFTENSSSFSSAEITVGHFSYLSTSMDVHRNLTKSVVVTKQNSLADFTPKALIVKDDIEKENVTLRAIAVYLADKKSSRLSSIQEPIYSAKYFTQWVERRNDISFRDGDKEE